MKLDSKIFVAGHRGLVGQTILRTLKKEGYTNLVCKTSRELDLRNYDEVLAFFQNQNIEYVFLAAAKVGGIAANDQYPADFIRDNLMIQTNVIDASYKTGAKKLLFLGSTCIYPKYATQPMSEDQLLTGELESTNEAYAIAKISGIKMCQSYNKQYGTNFISAMPTNLYGPNDNFDLETSHVLPALIRKFHEAKKNQSPSVQVWGTGNPKREFLYVDDLAEACLFLMKNYNGQEIVNVGVGYDLPIKEIAEMIQKVVGFDGEIVFDTSKPDGTPRKLVDISKLKGMGWEAKTKLEVGLKKTYKWYLDHIESIEKS